MPLLASNSWAGKLITLTMWWLHSNLGERYSHLCASVTTQHSLVLASW